MQIILFVIPAVIIIAIILMILNHDGTLSPKVILGATIALVVTSAVLVPVLQDSDNAPSLPPTLSYGDYVEISEDTICSGSIEKLQLGGGYYAHAKSIGKGKIGTQQYNVDKSILDVYLFLGQSNAANWAGVVSSTVSPIPDYGAGYYFGLPWHQSNKNLNVQISDYSMLPLRYSGIESRIGGTDPIFAGEYHRLTGNQVYVINGAIGGVNIDSYLPGGTSYEYAQELFDAAMQKIDTSLYTPVLKSYIWIQGESDAYMSVDAYKTKFLQLHESLCSGEFSEYGAFNSAIISKVRAVNAPNPSTAQVQLAIENASIHLATTLTDSFTVTNGLMLADNLHYSQEGRNLLGVALAKFATTLT